MSDENNFNQSLPGEPYPRVSPECPTPESPWSAQPRVSLECPTPESPWSAQPKVSLKCPTPECPGVPNPRVSLECPTRECLYQERVGMFEAKELGSGLGATDFRV